MAKIVFSKFNFNVVIINERPIAQANGVVFLWGR